MRLLDSPTACSVRTTTERELANHNTTLTSCQGSHNNSMPAEGVFAPAVPQLCEERQPKKTPAAATSNNSVPPLENITGCKRAQKEAAIKRAKKEKKINIDSSQFALENDRNPKGGKWRNCSCMKRFHHGAELGNIKRHQKTGDAHYSGLMQCASIMCPMCAPKITERRKTEVSAMIETHQAAGGHLYMLTLTFSHHRHEKLIDSLGSQKAKKGLLRAYYLFIKTTAYKKASALFGFNGSIRALEVTHSDINGWHPHIHTLLFARDRLAQEQLQFIIDGLFEVWRDKCISAGLGAPNRTHGIDLKPVKNVAEYLQKWGRKQHWGVESELTKLHIKKGKTQAGMTPFDFLRAMNDAKKLGDMQTHEKYAALYRECCHAFYGQRQLFYSPGLKKRFGIEELSDEELVNKEDKGSEIIVSFTKRIWKAVLKHNARWLLLDLAETGGIDSVQEYLDRVVGGITRIDKVLYTETCLRERTVTALYGEHYPVHHAQHFGVFNDCRPQ